MIHSKSNFHVKYSISLLDFKKFGNLNIYCEKHSENFLEYFEKETGELYCYECEFKQEDCNLISDSKTLIHEKLKKSNEIFEKEKEIGNGVILNLDEFDDNLEKLFDKLLLLKEQKKKEIKEMKIKMKNSLEIIENIENEMKKELNESSVFVLSSIQQKSLKIQHEPLDSIQVNVPLNIFESVENFLKIQQKSEEKVKSKSTNEEEEIKSNEEVINNSNCRIFNLKKIKEEEEEEVEEDKKELRKRHFSLMSPRSRSFFQNILGTKKEK